MLIIIHGNALVSISQKISTIKKEFDPLSIMQLSGKEIAFEEAVVKISTPALFSEKRLVTLENYDDKIDLEKLPQDEDLTIVVKLTKALTVASVLLKKATKIGAQIIPLSEKDETSIFPFLDMLGEKKKGAFSQFEVLYAEYGSQYLLTMIFYLFRRLVTKPKNAPSFVLQKLAAQKRNFNKEKITSLYKHALETDFKIKSGLIDGKLGLTMLIDKVLTI